MCKAWPKLLCSSFWKLNSDDFPFSGPSLANLEPESEPFEVDGNDNDGDDDLTFFDEFFERPIRKGLTKDQKGLKLIDHQ